MSIEAYLTKIKDIAYQLAVINQPVPDSELVKRTLRGLPHTLKYQPFAQGITNRHTPISFTELRTRFLIHEQELECIHGRATPPLTPLSHHALVAQQHYQSFHNITHGNSRRPKSTKARYCFLKFWWFIYKHTWSVSYSSLPTSCWLP